MNFNLLSDMERNSVVGFRFHPTDHELVYKYLREKLDGLIIHCDDITELNIYNYEPSDLPDFSRRKSEDDALYFFCARNYKSLKSQWFKRTTYAGYWKPTGKPRVVKHKITKKKIGTKRTLVFHLGRPKGIRTEWVMHEYEYTDNRSKDGAIVKSNQGEFVLCKIKRKSESICDKSESSFNTCEACHLMASIGSDKSESSFNTCAAYHLMASTGSDKSESSFNIVASTSNQNKGDFVMVSEIIKKSESSFNTLIHNDQIEANNLVASPPEIVASPHKSESSFNTSIFTMDETELNHLAVLSNKSKFSYNANKSSDFLNGNENQILANVPVDGHRSSCLVASADQVEPSSDLPYGMVEESESSLNMIISSTFPSKETILAMQRNEDSYPMPFDSPNHIPDSNPVVSYDSMYGYILDIEDRLSWISQALSSKENQSPDLELGDYYGLLNFEAEAFLMCPQ